MILVRRLFVVSSVLNVFYNGQVLFSSSGVPYPPTKLELLSDCFNRTTTLKWITGAANNASITHFLIEQESSYEPNVFRFLANVTNPNATSVSLNLTGWAELRFRMRAVNRFGPSRPSLPTVQKCVTKEGGMLTLQIKGAFLWEDPDQNL